MACTDRELLGTHLTTKRQTHAVRQLHGKVSIKAGVVLLVVTWIEVAWRNWAKTGVHSVVDKEIGFVVTVVGTDAPSHPRVQLTAQPQQKRSVGYFTAKVWRKATGNQFLEAKAVCISLYRRHRCGVWR